MGQYGHIGAVGVPGQQYNPSPIARPQVSEQGGQPGWGRGYSATPPHQPPATQSAPTSGKQQMNQYFSEGGADASEEGTVGEKTGEAADAGDAGVAGVDAGGEGAGAQQEAAAAAPPPEDTPAA